MLRAPANLSAARLLLLGGALAASPVAAQVVPDPGLFGPPVMGARTGEPAPKPVTPKPAAPAATAPAAPAPAAALKPSTTDGASAGAGAPAPVQEAPATLPPPPTSPASAPAAEATAPRPAQPSSAKPAPAKPSPVRDAAMSQDARPTLDPDTLARTMAAAERYAAIAEAGGWPTLPAGPAMKLGAKGPTIALLQRRLAAEGDLDPATPERFVLDASVVAAVKRFQARHGIAETGIVAGQTLRAMNVPAAQRVRALQVSARRLAASAFAFGPRYVVVNLPAAAVEAVENGAVSRRYVAVVGDRAHPSPQVEARIGAINFHPTWTVPTSIIKNEIIPHMRRDPNYLAKQKIRVLDANGAEVHPNAVDWSGTKAVNYTLRQDPGAGNSLGLLRIAMPNRHAVYMHDTPSKRLFGADFRFGSHGCVRVSDVKDLVRWLLEGVGGWDRTMIEAALALPERRDVRLANPVPVAWVYLTGYATPDGAAHFRDDVYGLDADEATAPGASTSPIPAAPTPAAPTATPQARETRPANPGADAVIARRDRAAVPAGRADAATARLLDASSRPIGVERQPPSR